MDEVFNLIKTGWTPGAAGVWVLVVMSLLGVWKGLPAVLDAWSNRLSKEAERTDREIARLEAQIASSDQRHADCEERCKKLQGEVDELHSLINGMMRQERQRQVSAIRTGYTSEPQTVIGTLITELDQVPSGDLKG